MANFSMLAAMSQQQHVAQSFLTGAQVLVKGYDCKGTVRYYGPHLSKAKRVGGSLSLPGPPIVWFGGGGRFTEWDAEKLLTPPLTLPSVRRLSTASSSTSRWVATTARSTIRSKDSKR